jgi:hypothetical protein
VSAAASRHRRLVPLLAAALVLLVCSALAEAAVRLAGFRPFRAGAVGYTVEPENRQFERDSLLGYRHLAGRFRVSFPTGYSFTMTHLPSRLRITRPLEEYGRVPTPRGEIWVFGGSFTHGWAVNDQETYPWLLHQRFPDYEVVNFGVGGYGTLHGLLQFRRALEEGRRPALVVVTYASFDDIRNTAGRAHRKTGARYSKIPGLTLPYARMNGDRLDISHAVLAYRSFPFTGLSAFTNLVEDRYNRWEQRRLRNQEVSRSLMDEFARLARERGTRMVVALMDRRASAVGMAEHCRSRGIPVVDIAEDLTRPGWTMAPHDNHPSPLAHRAYAERLAAFIEPLLP